MIEPCLEDAAFAGGLILAGGFLTGGLFLAGGLLLLLLPVPFDGAARFGGISSSSEHVYSSVSLTVSG